MSSTIETKRLLLLSGKNERDNAAFLRMLKEDGDFEMFSGIEYSEKNLQGFDGYLEREGFYAIYPKNDPKELFGYVGIAWNLSSEWYEAEFYIKRDVRRRGYCKEALHALCQAAYGGAVISQSPDGNGNPPELEAVYAVTQTENHPAKLLLSKCGFHPTDRNVITAFRLLINPETEETYWFPIVEYVLERQ